MQVRVQVKGLPNASALRRFAANRLNVALIKFSPAVQEVTILMNDINGPDRGGVDKLCRVVLSLKDNSVLVVEELGLNMIETINRVTDSLHHTVSKQLSRMVRVDRGSIRLNGLTAEMA